MPQLTDPTVDAAGSFDAHDASALSTHTNPGYIMELNSRKYGKPLLIGVKEATELLAIAERTLSKYTATGAVPSLKLGGARRYVITELRAWIDAGCPTEPGAGDAIRERLRGGVR